MPPGSRDRPGDWLLTVRVTRTACVMGQGELCLGHPPTQCLHQGLGTPCTQLAGRAPEQQGPPFAQALSGSGEAHHSLAGAPEELTAVPSSLKHTRSTGQAS